MNRQEQTTSKPSYRGIIRQILRLAWLALLYWIAIVVSLSMLYWIIPPVSTLMIGDWIRGKTVVRQYVPLEKISVHVPRAVLAAEDASFCEHGGVDWKAMGDVIKAAIRRGPSRGASTIAMQTSKNLFMVTSRSYIRKGLEIPVAMYLDLVWSKRRMIEVYLNIAEWGDGIYGIEAASRHYFGKPARLLGPREAALLAVALPNPILRNPGNPAGYHQALAGRLVQRMNNEGPIDSCFR